MALASTAFVGAHLVSSRRVDAEAAGITSSVHQLSRGRQHVIFPQPHFPRRRLLSESLSISETFADLKKQGKVAFIPYITAGDPDLSSTSEALKVLDACGSDIIELGVPYCDPLLDGPVIQVIPQISCPITLFSYYNPILKYGVPKFLAAMKAAGIRGLIIPDLPFEEAKSMSNEAKSNKIELVLLTTPTTEAQRMKAIAEASEGFIYLVSHCGVTGACSSINPELPVLLQRIKEVTDKPIAVGFGISKAEHVHQLSTWGADGVIVGSAIVKLLGETKSPREGLKAMEDFTKSLISVLEMDLPISL